MSTYCYVKKKTEKRVENMMGSRVYLTNFKVVKHCLEVLKSLIYLLN